MLDSFQLCGMADEISSESYIMLFKVVLIDNVASTSCLSGLK